MQRNADANEIQANNDYARNAALLDEYNSQADRDLNRAKLLAGYGDFSGYANLPEYGQDVANNMASMWYVQNPDLAYTMGYITDSQRNNIKSGKPINQGLDGSMSNTPTSIGGSASGGSGYYSGGFSQETLDFQRAYNAAHPNNPIAEDGIEGPETDKARADSSTPSNVDYGNGGVVYAQKILTEVQTGRMSEQKAEQILQQSGIPQHMVDTAARIVVSTVPPRREVNA